MNLIGLVIKGKPIEFQMSNKDTWMVLPKSLKDVKEYIQMGLLKDFECDLKGNIVANGNKKLSDYPMYDKNGNIVNKEIKINTIVKKDGLLIGAVVLFIGTGEEKKLKLDDLLRVYEYCEPVNFTLRNRDNNYYITGKGDNKKEDIPVIEKKDILSVEGEKEKIEYISFEITKENRHLLGFEKLPNPNNKIPRTFEYEGKYYKVTSIGKGAFENYFQFFIEDEDGIGEGDRSSFISSFIIPDTVTNIGDDAFGRCFSIMYFSIPNSVTHIGNGAFYNCDGLTSVVIPDSVVSIGEAVFLESYNLTSVVIPKAVTFIGERTFAECFNLNTIYYRGSKSEWDAISKGKNWDLRAGQKVKGGYKIVYNYK